MPYEDHDDAIDHPESHPLRRVPPDPAPAAPVTPTGSRRVRRRHPARDQGAGSPRPSEPVPPVPRPPADQADHGPGVVMRRRVTPDQTTVFRVLIFRQPGMLPNPDGKNFDAIDVCIPQAVGRRSTWKQGDYVEVTGFFQQRDARENLAHLACRAKDLTQTEKNDLTLRLSAGQVSQSKVEVVATQWRYLGKRENIQ
jgi:hypothetical protein